MIIEEPAWSLLMYWHLLGAKGEETIMMTQAGQYISGVSQHNVSILEIFVIP